jgi:hypothetical protein
MWNEAYDALSNHEKGEFRRLCNYLLSHTYVVREVYRPDKQWAEPSADYRMISRLFPCMQEYFAVSGWRLEKDENYGVISLVNELDYNHLRVDRFTTLFLYTCRLIYEEGRDQGGTLRIVRTDTGAVVEKMRILGLLDKGRTTQKERLEAQRMLAHFNLIQKTDAAAWSAEGNDLLILPSILSALSNQSLNDLMGELEELRVEEWDTAPDPNETDEPDEPEETEERA